MNKYFMIGLSVAITAFLAINAILLFSEKSQVPKKLYINEYERAYTSSYTEKLPKEAITAPLAATEIFIQDSDAVEQWIINEGDSVEAGTELALLNEAESEEQRAIWEAEEDALNDELREVRSVLRELETASSRNSRPTTGSSTNRDTATNANGDTVELDVNVQVEVEVPQDGSYAAGVAETEQRIAALETQLAVVEAQLDQNTAKPALISPIEGIVGKIDAGNMPMSIEIYSSEKLFMTYVVEKEWLEVNVDDRVFLHVDGVAQAMPGKVLRKSQLPADSSKWLDAYRALDPIDQNNPIAIYEVLIMTEEPITDAVPYGKTANASIIINEAADAVALKDAWIFDRYNGTGKVSVLNAQGRAESLPVTIAFDLEGKAVLSEGVLPGSTVVDSDILQRFAFAPQAFLPFPSVQPDMEHAKNTEWRRYVEYLLAR
ncbi:efflux RND transporter periplasmic adaptor subunit [Planococcus halotolerans]|uniref:Efflux RND transporter periplasmic adaptor subunit n=1 Tax=Planococcus halotolerans TaxID=2233542 RepID=A0A365L5Q4_9BACL|nr:efflux RND transporter periplasmic adaptor subunit [Planococcus halotolerans]RAZ80758.1 efflux RND transporter periplasmic adaptor subunit [Planococcus halotolerans]